MSEKIKYAAKFSEDAIQMALDTLTTEEWEGFQRGLNLLTGRLGEKKEKKKSQLKEPKLSDEVIFKENVIPDIKKRMMDIEREEMNKAFQITVDFAIKTDFKACNVEDLLTEHTKIVLTEEGLKALTLFAQYSRGLLYLSLVEKLNENGHSLRNIIDQGRLSVSHTTALRYMTLASIILKYPRLLICQMTFTQIMKHKKSLLNFLAHPDGHDLHCRLSLPLDITAQGHKIKIQREDIITPTVKFNTDADWQYHDQHTKAPLTDEELKSMVDSRVPDDEESQLQSVM